MPLTAPERLADLGRALTHEAGVVHRLEDALVAQRDAIAADDPHGVDASVNAIGAVLSALDRARRQRAAALDALTGDPDLPLDRLEALVGEPVPSAVGQARAALRQAAQSAAREAAVNRAVLRRAMEAGDAFLQALLSSAGQAAGYRSDQREAGPAGCFLVDRKI